MRETTTKLEKGRWKERRIIIEHRAEERQVAWRISEMNRVDDIMVDRGSVANEFHECHGRNRKSRKNQRVKRSRPSSSYRRTHQPGIGVTKLSSRLLLGINRSFCTFHVYSTQYSSTLIYHLYYRLLRNATKKERREKNRGALERTEVTGNATMNRNRQRLRQRPVSR